MRPETTRSRFDVEAGKHLLSFGERTYVMGVLNVTPDSFSDGGRYLEKGRAIERAFEMAGSGADILDIGGESTRPGAIDVGEAEEMDRVIPVIEGLAKELDRPISIDTRKSRVAEEAIKRGASIVNDVSGLKFDSRMGSVAARHGVALVLMHMKGSPQDMQIAPSYKDLVPEVIDWLRHSIESAKACGVSEEKIIVDPGIGFGKTAEDNLEILNRLDEFKILKRPICVGVSRKSFIGKALGLADPDDRLAGSLAASAVAIMNGANIIRVHDVGEAAHAARMVDSIVRERVG